MNWLFNILLKINSKSEDGRLKIHKLLQEQVNKDYQEQTVPGNIYNNQIEVIMSNEVIQKAIEEENFTYLKMIKKGIDEAFDEALIFIKDEKK